MNEKSLSDNKKRKSEKKTTLSRTSADRRRLQEASSETKRHKNTGRATEAGFIVTCQRNEDQTTEVVVSDQRQSSDAKMMRMKSCLEMMQMMWRKRMVIKWLDWESHEERTERISKRNDKEY